MFITVLTNHGHGPSGTDESGGLAAERCSAKRSNQPARCPGQSRHSSGDLADEDGKADRAETTRGDVLAVSASGPGRAVAQRVLMRAKGSLQSGRARW